MTDEMYSQSALFFFLLTLDDRVATDATIKAIELIRLRLTAKGVHAENPQIAMEIMVRGCLECWTLVRFRFQKEQIKIVNSKALIWPHHIDLSPWKEFQKRAGENDLIAVALVHVLGVPENIVASCLNVSEGTIRYRVGRGLSLLGQLNRPSTSPIQYS